MQKKIISLIIPCFNEEQNIAEAYTHITTFWKTLSYDIDYEMVFIDDGSRDSTVDKVMQIAKTDSKVKLLQFSRNFGK